MKISIIIPAYNEEKRIGKTLYSYSSFFKKIKNVNTEILVVINNTKDNTLKIVKEFRKKNKKINYLNLKEGGKGYAVMKGFSKVLESKPDLIGFVDADMSTSPEAFYDLVKNLGNYQGIIASRYISGASVSPRPTISRIIVSRIYNSLIRALFLMSFKDTQCGAKLFKLEAIKSIINKMGMTQWAFDIELLYLLRNQGFKVKEFPSVWSDKEYSTINFMKAGPWMALAVIRLRILNSPFKSFIRIYDKLISVAP